MTKTKKNRRGFFASAASPPPPPAPLLQPQAQAPSRVLLVNLNKYTQPYPVYPLGLSYINGALRAAGFETLFWDSQVNRDEITACAKNFRPDFIGLSLRNIDNAQSHNPLSFVRELADCCAALREVTTAPVIVGGSGFSIFPKELLELTGADYGIQGEGEAPFLALLAALRARENENAARDTHDARAAVRGIPGVVWRDDFFGVRDFSPAFDGGIHPAARTKGGGPINWPVKSGTEVPHSKIPGKIPSKIPSKIPAAIHCNPRLAAQAGFVNEPAHDPEVLGAYVAAGSLIGVQTQRGCPLKCCYCPYPLVEGRRSRFRSGAEVAEEMARLAALGARYTFIVDSVFNTSEAHVIEVCEALIARKLDMEWECFLRPRGVTREHLALMRAAGMRHIEFGSDSFSDPVLAAYGKSFTYDDIRRVSLDAHALDLRYGHFLIFGGPGETPASVDETLRRSAELPDAFYFATIGMRIYPGTPLWEKAGPAKTGEPPENFLATPRFHLEPPLTTQSLFAKLTAFRENAHNWVVGDPTPAFIATMEKLRRRGIRGPLWEYIEVLQRYAKNA